LTFAFSLAFTFCVALAFRFAFAASFLAKFDILSQVAGFVGQLGLLATQRPHILAAGGAALEAPLLADYLIDAAQVLLVAFLLGFQGFGSVLAFQQAQKRL